MNIGEKLRFWGTSKFGSIREFANALGMKPPSLYSYLKNTSVPGGELLQKLLILGCDINWLLNNSLDIESYKSTKNGVEAQSDCRTDTLLNAEEMQILNKLRILPEAIPLINSTLSGIIEARNGLSELQDLIVKDRIDKNKL